MSEDPIGFIGNDPNLYRYVFNNPISYRDPSGLFLGGFLNPGGNAGAIGAVGGAILGGIFGGIPGAFIGGSVGGAIGSWLGGNPIGDNDDGPQGIPPQSSCNPALQSCSSPIPQPPAPTTNSCGAQ